MGKRLFTIAVLAIGMITLLGSCDKDPYKTFDDDEYEFTEAVCAHDSLIHVKAVEPTGEENGCIEHYLCADCGQAYADAEGTIPVESTILWATNYILDAEEIMDEFDEFAGDEDYLWSFIRECVDAYDGSIYNFSGWEEWTDEEWDAFWKYIEQLIVEWLGEDYTATKVSGDRAGTKGDDDNMGGVLDAAGMLLTAIVNANLANNENIDCSIMDLFDKDFKIHQSLRVIIEKLNDIQQSIKDISDKINDQIYKDAMNARYVETYQLGIATSSKFQTILQYIEDEGKNYSELSAETKGKIKKLAEKWYSQIVNANSIEVSFQSMMKGYQGGFNIENKTMPDIYDYIADHTAAWEHETYAFKEMARNVDAVLMAECYLMELIYYNTHPDEIFDTKQQINGLILQYVKTLQEHKVVRHDYFLCKIPGAEAKLKKELKLIDPYEYIISYQNEKLWNEYHRYRPWLDKNAKVFEKGEFQQFNTWLLPTGSVSQDWHRVVYQYYERIAKSQGKQIGSNFLYDLYTEIGFKNVPTGSDDWIIADCRNRIRYNLEGRRIYEIETFRIEPEQLRMGGSKSGKDLFGFHTVVGKQDGCYINRAAIQSMYIDISDSLPGEITVVFGNNGSKVPNREFYAIEKWQ